MEHWEEWWQILKEFSVLTPIFEVFELSYEKYFLSCIECHLKILSSRPKLKKHHLRTFNIIHKTKNRKMEKVCFFEFCFDIFCALFLGEHGKNASNFYKYFENMKCKNFTVESVQCWLTYSTLVIHELDFFKWNLLCVVCPYLKEEQ